MNHRTQDRLYLKLQFYCSKRTQMQQWTGNTLEGACQPELLLSTAPFSANTWLWGSKQRCPQANLCELLRALFLLGLHYRGTWNVPESDTASLLSQRPSSLRKWTAGGLPTIKDSPPIESSVNQRATKVFTVGVHRLSWHSHKWDLKMLRGFITFRCLGYVWKEKETISLFVS